MLRHVRALLASTVAAALACAPVTGRAAFPPSLTALHRQLVAVSAHAPGRVGIDVEDLATGLTSGVNARVSLPAASTIKIPVMVEVFEQMESGRLRLDTVVHLEDRDRDWGWGDLVNAPTGTARSVEQLLWLMITQSDNTAANMLIRLVGRAHINATMARLGLRSTYIGDYIRSESDTIRYGLRTSPHDMVALLARIAHDDLIDAWASREMLAILTGQTHNGLLPVPLPHSVRIAHKTGELHDTLNDVGIVYRDNGEPYVIAVMTTQLADLDLGYAFIRRISRVAYNGFMRFATRRAGAGIAAFSVAHPTIVAEPAVPLSPDEAMWNALPSPGAPPPSALSTPGPTTS